MRDSGVVGLISVSISLFFFYFLVVAPLVRWGRGGGPRRLVSEVTHAVDKTWFLTSRALISVNKGIIRTSQPIKSNKGRIVIKLAAAVIAGMFVYMPANKVVPNGYVLDFTYRFLWDMGQAESPYLYVPNIPVLLSQIVGVAVVAFLLSFPSKR